jgi:hypothetical protein
MMPASGRQADIALDKFHCQPHFEIFSGKRGFSGEPSNSYTPEGFE